MATLTQMGGPILAAAGTINNMEVWQYWGSNSTVGTSFEDINGANADLATPVLVGSALDIKSASSDDDGAPVGSGALTVKVDYLDATFDAQTETVTLNGTTEVAMTNVLIPFVNQVRLASTGTGLASAGAISMGIVGGADIAILDAGATQVNQTKCMIPRKHTGYCYGFWADIIDHADGAGTCEVALQIAENERSGIVGSETWQTVAVMTLVENDDDVVSATGGNVTNNGFFEFPGGVPYIIPAKCMVRLAAKAGVAVGVEAGFSIIVAGESAGSVVTDS